MDFSPLRRYQLPLVISSWLTFAVALTLYWITADPGASYWDCPEYVTVASRMEVGHPPGNPIWMLAMRVATIPFASQHHAYVINLCSGIFMAFASLFVCRIIFIFLVSTYFKAPAFRNGNETSVGVLTGIIAFGSSLCFALCDSAWYSAVEAEVYAMSAFLSGLALWVMALWWWEESPSKRKRLLILVAYITGISLGVHQLNLLLIPVFGLIIFYRRHRGKANLARLWVWILGSFATVGIILLGIMPFSLAGAEKFELLAVNGLNLPYNTGIAVFFLLIFLLIVLSLLFSGRFIPGKGAVRFQTAIWMLFFILTGYSSFAMIMIRANAYPAMNEGVPDDIFSLSSYIAREQYPSTPLLYGSTPNSRPLLEEEIENGKPVYRRFVLEKGKPEFRRISPGARLNHRSRMLTAVDSNENSGVLLQGHGYLLTDYNFRQKLTPELNMWLPRITSRKPADIEAYEGWGGMSRDNMVRLPVSEAVDSDGNFVSKISIDGTRPEVFSYRPSYVQNFRFFMAYQAYYMYFRYLFWNFIGRQNDFPSTGEIEHGNFMTGFSSIDSRWLGVTDKTPPEIGSANKGHNRYFGIPFLFGILGILFLLAGNRNDRRLLSVISLFFFMTGIAIVIYLNQSPGEPRERDYTFLGSYMAFAMWIAVGIAGCVKSLFKFKSRIWALSATFIFSAGVPTLMAIENFDDHDRRGRFETAFYASSLLDFDYPAIIFSHGDNSTFPLWYSSEVLGKGKSHTVVDVTYLALPSYVGNLRKQGSRGIATLSSSPQTDFGAFLLTKIPSDSIETSLPLPELLKSLYDSDKEIPEFPAPRFSLPDNKGDSVYIRLREFTGGSAYLSFKHLMLLDFLASQLIAENPKIIFFPHGVDFSFYRPLEKALTPVLFGKIYAPFLSRNEIESFNRENIDRELGKISRLFSDNPNFNHSRHYSDPVIADRSRRYRGELIAEAFNQIGKGETVMAANIADSIHKYYNYNDLWPGDFTLADSTYYEGKEYKRLMDKLYEATDNSDYSIRKNNLDSLMQARHLQWLEYYRSLPSSQRATFSNRSRRLLKSP